MTSVAIFGATSAIAEQVARLYAAEGARLFLAARDQARLEAVAADLSVRGGKVTTYVADFAAIAGMDAMLDACEAAIGKPDVALVAYGVLGDQARAEADPAVAAAELNVNFTSPACLLNALALRVELGAVIAAITSVAGDRGRQSNYVYGAAKAGLSTFLEGLRHRLAAKGVAVVDIRPGPVDTPMTSHMPKSGSLWAQPERVARDIKRAIERRRPVAYTPWHWRHAMTVIRAVPRSIFHRTKL